MVSPHGEILVSVYSSVEVMTTCSIIKLISWDFYRDLSFCLKRIQIQTNATGKINQFEVVHTWFMLVSLVPPLSDLHQESRVKPLSPSEIPQLLRAVTQGCRPAPVLLTRSPPWCHSAAVWSDLASAGLSSSVWTHRQSVDLLGEGVPTQKILYLCTYSEINVENTGKPRPRNCCSDTYTLKGLSVCRRSLRTFLPTPSHLYTPPVNMYVHICIEMYTLSYECPLRVSVAAARGSRFPPSVCLKEPEQI